MLSLLHHPAATAFGYTLLHALWQAALIAGFVALLHTQLTTARQRYATALAGLLLLPGLAVATFYYYYTPLAPVAPVDATQWLALLEAAGADGGAATAPTHDWQSWLPYLTVTYLVGLSLFALRLASAGVRLYFLRRRGLRPVDPAWRERMDALNRRYGIRPPARLSISNRVDQVLSFGHFKPLILFPVGLLNQLTPAEVEAILLHELAHLQRRDYLWNWLQSAVETAYFFHPAVYWLGRRIRHERECCCDDWVAQRTDKTIYAQSLINLARFAQTPINQLAMYANSTRSPLGQRIERLFQPAARRRSVLPLLLLLVPFVLLAWRPLQETTIDETTPETWIANEEQATSPGAQTPDGNTFALQSAGSAVERPAVTTSEIDTRTAAAVYVLAPREVPLLSATEGPAARVLLDRIFPSETVISDRISTRLAPLAIDTLPKQSEGIHPQTLFILDGERLPRGSNDPLQEINPADIVRIDVYKDDSAVDKFGAEGEHGVVVITTRRKRKDKTQPTPAPSGSEQQTRVRLRQPDGKSAEPRYVVDGDMLPEGQPLDIRPEEIESIKVWKGESATDRYGAAGENGVIDIITKTGSAQRAPAPDAPIHLDADDQKTRVRIRSTEQQQPLFIIDGKVLPKGTGQPADLAPEDIESVEVLKGEAAVDRFGSDAADGAVLIQTKEAAKRQGKVSPKKAKKLRFGPGITVGDPNPLYVIDGVVQTDSRAVERLDKEDIELINVRKNEPARAAYGNSIGDRTVIEITLKGTAPAPRPHTEETPQPESAPAPAPATSISVRSKNAPAPAPSTTVRPQTVPAPAPQPMAAPQYLSSTLYPNPTSGKTQIRFTLESEERVTLDVFDAQGRRVRSRQFGRLPAGAQQLEFDAADLPTGTYTVTILAGGSRWKATLVRP